MSNRNYKKGAPHRDSKLFIIVAEGEREDEYFSFFHNQNQRIKISLAPREKNASAPNHFLNRLEKFKQEERWNPKDDDVVWFVLNVDLWKREPIDELINFCKNDKTLNIAISNPCFEVWLLYHLLDNLENIGDNLKNELHLKTMETFEGSYHPIPSTFCPRIQHATANAKVKDENPSHAFPNPKQTKVYLLAEQLIEKLGKNWL